MSKGFKIALIILAVIAIIGGGWVYSIWPKAEPCNNSGYCNVMPPFQKMVYSLKLKVSSIICAIRGLKYSENFGFLHCQKAYVDFGKACQRSSECEGLCIVVKPDLSKMSPVISSNIGLHREPAEFSKCRLSASNGYGSYQCPPDAGIVAQCSNYSFEEDYWEYNDGKIQPALDRALQYGTVTN